jgi:hypothetical protein
MSLTDVLQFIGLITMFILGLYNAKNNGSRAKSQNTLETSQYLVSMNQAVDLANKRALEAEEGRARAEERTLQAEAREEDLERRLTTLEKSLAYRLTFDVILGTNPSVEKVEIKHFPERRESDTKTVDDRRSK